MICPSLTACEFKQSGFWWLMMTECVDHVPYRTTNHSALYSICSWMTHHAFLHVPPLAKKKWLLKYVLIGLNVNIFWAIGLLIFQGYRNIKWVILGWYLQTACFFVP